jgi:hypothetical protein
VPRRGCAGPPVPIGSPRELCRLRYRHSRYGLRIHPGPIVATGEARGLALAPYPLAAVKLTAAALSLAAHAGLAALATPAAPVGVAALLICTPAALAAYLVADSRDRAAYRAACGRG